MWPKLSNIRKDIVDNLIGVKSTKKDLNASQRVAWIRVFSGAEVNYAQAQKDKQGNPVLGKDGKAVQETKKSSGLILQSNGGFEIFRAAGQNKGAIYGDRNTTGDIGLNWEGTPVPSTMGDGVLRPGPMITGLEIKEGTDQISRECTLRLKCFTLGQMEQMQTYFLEPGYSLCIEFGWNSVNAGKFMFDAGKKTEGILTQTTDRNLNPDALDKARNDSKGDYDTFLGFIVGGNCTSEGDKWTVEVKLRGAPGLPTFLQTQNKTLGWNQVERKPVPSDAPQTYSPDDLAVVSDAMDIVLARRWKNMFNQLPATRQTNAVKKIYENGKCIYTDFINFDAAVNKAVTEYTSPGFGAQALHAIASVVGIDAGESSTYKVGDISIEKSKLFSTNKYISMDLAVKILNENSEFTSFNMGGKKVSVHFDIDECVIGAFPHMFSTKSSKLLIPNNVPDFSQYFLSTATVTQGADGTLNGSSPIDVIPQGKSTFSQQGELKSYGLKEVSGGYWGYLKDLYINFDMFVEKLQTPNKNIREVFLDMLNEMSAAACSFWNFQISEQKSKDGTSIIISVHDENWIGSPVEQPATFYHSGPNSVFLEANLNIALPSEMTSQIVSSRLALANNPNQQPIPLGGFFTSATDLFLQTVDRITKQSLSPAEKQKADEEAAAKKKEQDEKDPAYVDAKIKELMTQIDVKSEGPYTEYSQPYTYWVDKATGQKIPNTDPRVVERERLVTLFKTVKETKAAETEKTLTGNLAKIDVIPNPKWAAMNVGKTLADLSSFKTYFQIYAFDDTAYFDLIKRTYFERGGGTLSHPIPIRYSFKVMGTSGIRRGDTFNIIGIPRKYTSNGLFQVEQVEHNIDGNLWTTHVTGIYRTKQGGKTAEQKQEQLLKNNAEFRKKLNKIICNELYNQGFLPKHIWEADEQWGEMMYKKDRRLILGYMMWAKHVVDYMKAKPQNTKWIYMIIKPWTEYMAYQMGVLPKNNWIGKLFHNVAKHYCYYVYDTEMKKRKKLRKLNLN